MVTWYLPCRVLDVEPALTGLSGGLSLASNGIDYFYGEWTWRMWQPDTGQSAQATILFAGDCAAATFVSEPGSIMLLGSGLADLAGYATLRWRTGE